jgi:hypothetical protein
VQYYRVVELLLTGRVYSDFKGWSTEPLGIGLLSNKAEVGRRYLVPINIWLPLIGIAPSCERRNGIKQRAFRK